LSQPTPVKEEDPATKTENGTSTAVKKHSQGIQDRMWEKEQLQEINMRVDNIFNVFGAKLANQGDKIVGVDDNVLTELRDQQTKAMKELSDNFLNKEAKKAKELADAKAENRGLQEKAEDLKKELEDLNLKNNNLKKENSNLKQHRDQALREKDKALTDEEALRDSFEVQLKTLQDENDHLSRMKVGGQDPEEELQRRFAKRMAEMLQERDDLHNQLKEQMDDSFNKKMKELEKNYEQQLQDMKDGMQGQKKQLEALQNDFLRLSQERDQLKRDLEKEKPLRDAIENDLKKQKEQAKEELKRVADKGEQVQKDYRQMCDERFALEKMNWDLQVEIQALKQKIDSFEQQHHIESPLHKKRRRTDSSLMDPKVLKSVEGPLIASNTKFPLECSSYQFEGDWTGFELRNQWLSPIILRGWQLTDAAQSSRLSLPEKKLNPNEIIRVCLTDKKKEPTDLVWSGLKIKKGEHYELWAEDSLGKRRKVASLLVPATGTAAGSCFVM